MIDFINMSQMSSIVVYCNEMENIPSKLSVLHLMQFVPYTGYLNGQVLRITLLFADMEKYFREKLPSPECLYLLKLFSITQLLDRYVKIRFMGKIPILISKTKIFLLL